IRRTELSLFLRYRKCTDRDWIVEREPADSLLASRLATHLSVAVRSRSYRRIHFRTPRHRLHRIHVRSEYIVAGAIARALPLASSAATALGGAPPGMRSSRVALGNARAMD